MANLYRKPVVRTDPKTGKKVKGRSKKWWGQYKDADGRLRRHPLAEDKKAAQAMLNEIVRRVEREKAGLVDPTDVQRKRPLKDHISEYDAYLSHKGVTDKQRKSATSQIKKMVAACKWKLIQDITATGALAFLGDLRTRGRSAQTYNHYLKSAKSFTRWLVRDGRTTADPLAHLSKLNVAADRRHDRRALTTEEFRRLLAAAREGKRIEGLAGGDRAMLYAVAAWTGFRKGEIGSLTLRSLDLDSDPPTATVAAGYSKRRREDTQVLHPDLVAILRDWLATRDFGPAEPLFPISGQVAGGKDRRTYKMMQRDLAAAREAWIEEGKTEQEKQRRERTDFLAYCDHAGLYADFHSCRHLFITSLSQAGLSPKMAQTLARHSDIRLTLQTYTHIELADQTAAIGTLPGPPSESKESDVRLRTIG